MPVDGRLKIVSNDSTITSELTIQSVMLMDAGMFTCVTFNPNQQSIESTSSVTLIVEGKAM